MKLGDTVWFEVEKQGEHGWDYGTLVAIPTHGGQPWEVDRCLVLCDHEAGAYHLKVGFQSLYTEDEYASKLLAV